MTPEELYEQYWNEVVSQAKPTCRLGSNMISDNTTDLSEIEWVVEQTIPPGDS